MRVAVVRLGVGNTASVMFALERLGVKAVLTDDPSQLADAERMILPGVGAAAHAMRVIDAKGLRAVLISFARPLLGICLGQQLLYDTSEEGEARGLGILRGRVTRLPVSPEHPSPHMGWSRLEIMGDHPLMDGVKSGAYAYFVHSYVCPMTQETLASAEYGRTFAAIVGTSRVFGCQFHPERSGEAGARLLANFANLPC